MIMQIGTVPIYSGKVDNYKEHQKLLDPIVKDDSNWRSTSEWMSATQSTMGHEGNQELPWDKILEDIQPHLNDYLQIFGPTQQYGVQTRPWLNRYERGGWQEQHNHTGPGSHFSMSYIIDAQEQSNFVFADSVGNWYDGLWECAGIFANWPHRNLTPDQEDGSIFIFPNTLDHFVLPNQSDNYRVTASANFYITAIDQNDKD